MQLLALVADHERSGREVADLYAREAEQQISFGTLYTTFRRLKEAGWVRVREDRDEDGRVRFFSIEPSGLQALRQGREYYSRIANFFAPLKPA